MIKNLKEDLREFIAEKKTWWLKLLASGKFKSLYDAILADSRFSKYPNFEFTLQTMCYWIMHDLYDFPKCANEKCMQPLKKNILYKSGYNKHCCIRCAQLDGAVRKKITDTNVSRYGTSCSLHGVEQREKTKKTCLSRYGVESSNQSDLVKKKQIESCLRNNGVRKPLQSSDILKKQRQTMIQRFDAPVSWQSDEIKTKMKETIRKRYGVEFISQNENVKKKKRDTYMAKYGVDTPLKSPVVLNKVFKTNMKKFGTKMPLQNRDIMLKARRRYRYNGVNFDSKPELALYIWLTDNRILFKYQPNICFQYFDGKRMRRYFPDFEIEGKFYEIKGDQFFNEDGTMCNPFNHQQDYIYEAKRKCIVDNNIKILKSDDYAEYIAYVNKKYGMHFLEQFKMK